MNLIFDDITDFAVLDDSLVYKNGIYVYTHAFVLKEETPRVLFFFGNKKGIYNHENEIGEFIGQNLPEGASLIACNHYKRYEKIWELVFAEANQRLPRHIKQYFTLAHHSAKDAAKSKLDEILAQKL